MVNTNWKPGDKVAEAKGPLIEIDPKDTPARDLYKLLIGAIVPRPIAFVSSQSPDGKGNLAPFSFFNAVSSNPPCVSFSVSRKPNGEKKDTLRNIEATGQFVVHTANLWLAEALVHCAGDYPYGINELEKVGLTAIPSLKVKPFRVKECAFHMECETYKLLEIGDGSAGSSTLIVGKVLLFHILKSAYKDGKVLMEELEPVARLGGINYCLPGEQFALKIPEISSVK